MALDDKIASLDKKTKKQVEGTLKSINIALKLNSVKLKQKKIPKELQRLIIVYILKMLLQDLLFYLIFTGIIRGL